MIMFYIFLGIAIGILLGIGVGADGNLGAYEMRVLIITLVIALVLCIIALAGYYRDWFVFEAETEVLVEQLS